MKLITIVSASLLALSISLPSQATENYVIDAEKHHAFIQFKIKHLGFSWLIGRINEFTGTFTYDEKTPEKNSINLKMDITSIDTNHAERDKHLRSDDFFDVEKFPSASFTSSSYTDKGNGKGILTGTLKLHGVTKTVSIDTQHIGNGDDPWGNYRRGFEGSTTVHLSDFKFKKGAMLGPVAENVELYFSIEGIRK